MAQHALDGHAGCSFCCVGAASCELSIPCVSLSQSIISRAACGASVVSLEMFWTRPGAEALSGVSDQAYVLPRSVGLLVVATCVGLARGGPPAAAGSDSGRCRSYSPGFAHVGYAACCLTQAWRGRRANRCSREIYAQAVGQMPTQEELQKLLMIGFAVLFLGAARVQWPWLVAENAREVGILAHFV